MTDLQRLLPILLLVLAGCSPASGPSPEKKAPDLKSTKEEAPPAKSEAAVTKAATPEKTAEVKPAATPDKAESVAQLELLKCIFTKDANGNVTKADCKFAELNDEQVKLLADLPSLVDLSLENSSVTNDGLAILEKMPQLKALSLRRCSQLTDDGFVHLKHLVNLERLLLLYSPATDAGMVHVKPLKKLKLLDLRGCMQIGDGAMAQIKELPALVDLKIRTNALTDKGLAELKDMKFTTFNLEDAGQVTNEGIAHLKGSTNLRTLNLMRLRIDDAALKDFGELKQLKDLRLRGTSVDGSCLATLVGSKDTLTYLDLSETAFGSDAMANLAPFTNLETLELWAARITDDDLAQLAGMTKLKTLSLEQIRRITSAGMEHLLKSPVLETLNLKQTGIDDDALTVLAGSPKLSNLDLSNTSISDEALEKFQAAKPDCKVKY